MTKAGLPLISAVVMGLWWWIYSFSQVDLNLTLLNQPLYLQFQAIMTQIGYFQRPISALWYLSVIIGTTLIYYVLVFQSKQAQASTSKLIKVALIISIIYSLSYPALSYDLFNYMFYPRMIFEHGVNPYEFRPLDFPEDPWVRFMHWTHSPYPYGPSFLPVTIPFYLVGVGKFLLTFVSFKLLMFLSYWVTVWAIYQVFKTNYKTRLNQSLVLFMFNPLVLIEGLANAHIDMVMVGLMMAGLGVLVISKKSPLNQITGWFLLALSALSKYVSGGALLPVFLWRRGWLSFRLMVHVAIVLTLGLTMVVISQREVHGWYFLVPYTLMALIPSSKVWLGFVLVTTPSLLLRYLPYLYHGDYSNLVLQTRELIFYSVLLLFAAVYVAAIKSDVWRRFRNQT